jgi:hypothetical protein
MMLVALLFISASLLVLAALVWLVSKPLPEETTLSLDSKIEDLVPLHTQHFPQLRQALASADTKYVRQKATAELHSMWREERRQILKSFLAGLAEDFARLDRLGRIVASLTPRFSRREELARIWLSLRFRLTYRIVSIWISAGGAGSTRQLGYLTELVGNLSARAEEAMMRLEMRSPA